MARRTEGPVPAWDLDHMEPMTGFDVVVEAVIGTVTLDPMGTVSPHRAAFDLIAQHDMQGTFKFPMADGRTCVVEVGYEGPTA